MTSKTYFEKKRKKWKEKKKEKKKTFSPGSYYQLGLKGAGHRGMSGGTFSPGWCYPPELKDPF